MLDTSYFITLFDDTRAYHEDAKEYYKYFISNNVPMYLSTIMIAEYTQKDSIEEHIATGNFKIIPFTYDDAIISGMISNKLTDISRNASDTRADAKDDVKLLAQTKRENISHLITADERTLVKYCNKLRCSGEFETQTVVLSTGYDVSNLNGGQLEIE
jgi:predicted nucleic acid-binding protein